MSDDRRLADEIDAEITDHIERRVRELCRAGATESAARDRAAREFGDSGEAKRMLLNIDSRIERRRRPRAFSGLSRDVRTAARRLGGQPGPTALTVLTLALAIGVAAAVFSIVDQLILRPPPFPHAERLVDAWHLSGPNGGGGNQLSPRKILGWQEQAALFERFEAYAPHTLDLTESAEPQRIDARVVSLGLFDMLGVTPHIGRLFADGDGAPGSAKVAVLGHAFWRTRFGGSPDVLGERIVLNDEPHTIVGVLRHGMTLLTDDEAVWLPFDLRAWTSAPMMYPFFGIGRLAPSVVPVDAKAAADRIAAQLGASAPLRESWYLNVAPKTVASVAASTERMLFVLLGAVTLLLLIACVNVTSFALARSLRRHRELRLRAAIGASRWRLIREGLVETLLLAVAAGIAGLVVAYGALSSLLGAAPDRLGHMVTRPLELDLRVFAVMALVTVSAGLIAGLLPAMRASRVDLAESLSEGARGSSRGVAFGAGMGTLVVVEVALAMVLLVGAALMARTLAAYHALEPGFAVENLVTVSLDLPSHRYPTEQSRRDFFAALDAALTAHPDIDATAHAWGIPPETGFSIGAPQGEGEPARQDMEFPTNYVSPGYFAATGTPILAGRDFRADDTTDALIISESFARLLWPGPLVAGRRLRESPEDRWVTVIGIVGDVEARAAGRRTPLHTYHPLALPRPGAVPSPTALRPPRSYAHRAVIVRTSVPRSIAPYIRERIHDLDRDQPIGEIALGTEIYAEPLAQQRFLLIVMGSLAAIALLLAAMGIFGVLSQAVTGRRREIGIRVALGAGNRRLVRLFVGRGVLLAAFGIAAGAGASLLGVKALESLLFGVSPFDPVSFAAVTMVLLAVALVACWWPTRCALAVEPAEVLRSE